MGYFMCMLSVVCNRHVSNVTKDKSVFTVAMNTIEFLHQIVSFGIVALIWANSVMLTICDEAIRLLLRLLHSCTLYVLFLIKMLKTFSFVVFFFLPFLCHNVIPLMDVLSSLVLFENFQLLNIKHKNVYRALLMPKFI